MRGTYRQRLVVAAVVTCCVVIGGALAAYLRWQAERVRSEDLIAVGSQSEATAVGIWTGESYAYMLTDAAGAIVLIDAGSDPTGSAILAALAHAGREPSAIRAILLTHGHVDHWAGVAAFPGVPVYASRGDDLLARGASLPRALGSRWLTRFSKHGAAPSALRPVLAGMLLDFGSMRLEVVALPGHTPGSVAYRLGDMVFVGDSVRIHDGALTVWSRLFSDSPADNRRALPRLLATPFTTLADGHTGILTNAHAALEGLLTAAR